MKTCLDFYKNQASGLLSSDSWLARTQERALADFTQLNFPTRHDEDWKYTRLDGFLKQCFTIKRPESKNSHAYKPSEYEIAIVDGEIVTNDDWHKYLPSGVIIKSLHEALEIYPELLEKHLGGALKHTHGFQALNTAMMQTGVFVYIPKNTHLEHPMRITHVQDGNDVSVHYRHLIIADKGSSAIITEDYTGRGNSCYFTNAVTEIVLADNAKIIHHKIQRESLRAYHIGHIAVQQEASSDFISHSLSFGGALVRSDITVDLNASDAHCLLNGIYVPGDGQHVDHHTLINHRVPNCRSEQDYKGILVGKSRAVFNGCVVVEKNAQKTQANQQNKNLLLSKNSEIDTKPQLEIYADDVRCTHGATVGQLDEDALFYMAARGIPRDLANRFLVDAFAESNLYAIKDKAIRDWASSLLASAMEDVNE